MIATNSLLFCAVMLGYLLALAACQPIAVSPAAAQASSPSLAAQGDHPTVAFVRQENLLIQQGEVASVVEDCTDGCRVYFPTWSPDGQSLAYYYRPSAIAASHEIRLAILGEEGQPVTVQTVAQGVDFFRPPAWSPLGNQLAYLVESGRYDVDGQSTVHILEVWTAEVTAQGVAGQTAKKGDVGFGGECGGGGRSESANVYEIEGGYAFSGYLAGTLAWTADHLLLFSNDCTSHGIGRFDLTTGSQLEPYAGALRSLALNSERTSWIAVDQQDQLVQGTPASLAYEAITVSGEPELAFYGQMTDAIYYTTLEVLRKEDLFDLWQEQNLDFMFSPYFEFTQPHLWSLTQSGITETALGQDSAYAYARVQEGTDGSHYFSRIGDSDKLYDALQDGTLTAENVEMLRPTVDVMRVLPGSNNPQVWLPDAAQFTLAPK